MAASTSSPEAALTRKIGELRIVGGRIFAPSTPLRSRVQRARRSAVRFLPSANAWAAVTRKATRAASMVAEVLEEAAVFPKPLLEPGPVLGVQLLDRRRGGTPRGHVAMVPPPRDRRWPALDAIPVLNEAGSRQICDTPRVPQSEPLALRERPAPWTLLQYLAPVDPIGAAT